MTEGFVNGELDLFAGIVKLEPKVIKGDFTHVPVFKWDKCDNILNEVQTLLIEIKHLHQGLLQNLITFINRCQNLNSIVFKSGEETTNFYYTCQALKLMQDLPIKKIKFLSFNRIDEGELQRIAKRLPKTLKCLSMFDVDWGTSFFNILLERKIELVDLSLGYQGQGFSFYLREKSLTMYLSSYKSLESFELTHYNMFNFSCLENHKLKKIKAILDQDIYLEYSLASLISKQKDLKVLSIHGNVQTLELMKAIGNSTIEELIYTINNNYNDENMFLNLSYN